MKSVLLMLALCLSVSLSAGTIDDMFGGGEDEFEFERFSDGQILLAIDRDADMACHAGVCTLHSVDNNYGGWEVSFNLGEGSPQGNGGNTTNIYTGGNTSCDGCPRDYWGVQVKYSQGNCVQNINVPRSVYYSLNRYMYGLMTETGGTRRGFTPADEAMIMFYTTIMSKANGCTMQ
jgi:hypothetical protein